jgi:hypothetical protein
VLKLLTWCGIAMGLAFSCQSADANKPFSIYPFKVPEKYQATLNDYRTDWTRLSGFQYSGLHWKQFIVIYINQDEKIYANNYRENLRYYEELEELDEDELVEPRYKKYSPGTIVLKENFAVENGSPGLPISVTMMIKREKAFDTKHGDWEYVQFDPQGNIAISGKASDPAVNAVCSSCHVNIEERDFIFTNFYTNTRK